MTKLYFHNALTGDTGTLPSTVQSALGAPTQSADAAGINRSMDTTIGSLQVSKGISGGANSNGNQYFTRFCTVPLGAQTIASQTWNYVFAANAGSTLATIPSSATMNVTLYQWRPSSGTKIANVLDGAGSGFNTNATASEVAIVGTFTGSSVTLINADILCLEFYFTVVRRSGITSSVFYDGTVETNTAGTATSNQASHIECPSTTLTLAAGVPIGIDWWNYPLFLDIW